MRYIQRILPLALALSLVTAPAFASDGASTYEISYVYSNVSFSIMKFFFKEDGGFRSYTGEVYYDPAHPERSHVRMTVQADSIDTRSEGRDRALRSDDFFDVEHYPTLTFVSTSVTPRSGNLLDVTGDITIHGVTKHITIPARFLGEKYLQGWGDFVGFDTEFTIDRSAFGVNGSRWSGGATVLSKNVNIHLAIGAIRPGSQ
jgi:polyisoprenoid-binding protein YceI